MSEIDALLSVGRLALFLTVTQHDPVRLALCIEVLAPLLELLQKRE